MIEVKFKDGTVPEATPEQAAEAEMYRVLKGFHREVALRWAIAFTRNGKHFYAGTVPYKVKQGRRAANKVAKASRKLNRR